MRGMRELWIAREVSCTTSGTVAAQGRLSGEKGRISRTACLLSDATGLHLLSMTCEHRAVNVLDEAGYPPSRGLLPIQGIVSNKR